MHSGNLALALAVSRWSSTGPLIERHQTGIAQAEDSGLLL